MSTLKNLLRHYLSSETVLYECRNCGTTLEEEAEQCPQCGAEDISTYQLQ